MSDRGQLGPGRSGELLDVYPTGPDGEPIEPERADFEPGRPLPVGDRPARLMLVLAGALLLVAGLLFVAGARRPARFVDHVVTSVDPAPISGVDALGCWAGHSCVVRSARLAAYIANARTTVALDVAGWETVDRATDVVYRRVLSEFRAEPNISVHLIFQCVPNGVVLAPYGVRDGTASAGRFVYFGSSGYDLGGGCSAQYNYSIDSPGAFDPNLLDLDVLAHDSTLAVRR